MKGRKQMMKKRKWLVSLLAVVLTVIMLPIAAFCADCRTDNGGLIYPTKQKPKQMKRKAGAGA